MKKNTTIAVAIIASVLAVATATAGFFWWHNSEIEAVRAEEQAKTAVMVQRLNNAQVEKESLLDQLEELLCEEEVIFDAATVQEQILDIGELGTQEYRYTDAGALDAVVYFKDTTWKVPFTKKTAVVTMDGVIKAGVDVTKVQIQADEVTKTITVTIPEAKILSNELFENTMTVYVEEEGLFNTITLEDNSNLRSEIKDKAQQKALNSDLLEKAREEAGDHVRRLIEAVPSVKDTYTIKVR